MRQSNCMFENYLSGMLFLNQAFSPSPSRNGFHKFLQDGSAEQLANAEVASHDLSL